ncbi:MULTISPECIES: hypothetical protein [Streptomyces]|uniref:PIN domain-containing protein n=1 Tax=Streptomyces cacaoi TaxID=1898 RepID=A0A4Y3QTV8_STRCI|nr:MULTISPECIES: hypothetical protein [Streptomyces]NNG86563.1 hypothetical protein [Streptomyces cacaoi]QHF97449.1 hypothetical protein DEH18_30490 [Streptomyces sp. NHF165]GEB48836.1 hypothetical protein SCA03_13870 [Streptomyces cacaoi]
MARPVTFVDTSVLCNLLRVPHMDQDRAAVADELRARRVSSDLVLPVTAVLETGNHVAQVSDGRARRSCAERFSDVLRMVVERKAPWTLNRVEWDEQHLRELVAGAGTGLSLTELASQRLGCGDLCILAERNRYLERVACTTADIWTLDRQLASYA